MIIKENDYFKKNESPEQHQEGIFREVIENELLDVYSNELANQGFDDSEVEKFRVALAETDKDELDALLSWPYSLRKKFFADIKGKTAEDVIGLLRQKLQMLVEFNGGKYPKLGFHTSGIEIKPEKNKKGELVWQIVGREEGDLGDGPQAFASDNFANLYHEGKSNIMYVVRLGNDAKRFRVKEGHYHAAILSIIAQLDTEKIYKKMTEREKIETVELAA